MKNELRVLGVDIGLNKCGVALVHKRRVQDSKTLTTTAELDHTVRIASMSRQLEAYLEHISPDPDFIVAEHVPLGHLINRAKFLYPVSGALIALAEQRGIPVHFVSARKWQKFFGIQSIPKQIEKSAHKRRVALKLSVADTVKVVLHNARVLGSDDERDAAAMAYFGSVMGAAAL